MKNSLLLFVLTLILGFCTSCEEETKEISDTPEVVEEPVPEVFDPKAYDSLITRKFSDLIEAEYDSILINDSLKAYYVLNGLNVELITFITTQSKEVEFWEAFGFEKGQLVYAQEWYYFYSPPEGWVIPWRCEYSIIADSVVDYVSSGLGETESDDWGPESIFDQWDAKRQFFYELLESLNAAR